MHTLKFLLLSVLLFASLIEASKRSRELSSRPQRMADPYDSDSYEEPEITQPAKLTIQTRAMRREFMKACLFDDIIINICLHFLDELVFRHSNNCDPLGHLYLVNKQWYRVLHYELFREAVQTNPASAKFYLLKAPKISFDIHMKMLETVRNEIEDHNIFALMLLSDDVRILTELTRIRPLAHISAKVYQVGYNHLKKKIPEVSALVGNHRRVKRIVKAFDTYYSSNENKSIDERAIFAVPQHVLMIAAILDDLHEPYNLTWSFGIMMETICEVYHCHQTFHKEMTKWMMNVKDFRLPHLERPILVELLEWPALIAAICREDTFVNGYIPLDVKEIADNPDFHDRFVDICDAIPLLLEAKYNDLTAKHIQKINDIMNDKLSLGLFGFSSQSFLNGVGGFLNQLDDEIQLYILNDFQ